MILNFAYGIDAQSIQDPFMVMIQKGWDVMSAATNPGLFLVDTIPACTSDRFFTDCHS